MPDTIDCGVTNSETRIRADIEQTLKELIEFDSQEIEQIPTLDIQYLRVTINRTAIDSLKKAALFIKLQTEDQMNWKWVVLSLFDSLYAFAIQALEGGNFERVTFRTESGQLRLIGFDKAIKMCCMDRHMRIYDTSSKLYLSESARISVQLLRSLRNDFIHFIPKLWFVEVQGLPTIALDIIAIIEFLISKSGNIFIEEESRAEILVLFRTCRQELSLDSKADAK